MFNQATGAQLVINLGALRRNYRAMARASGGAVCAAVVKADGYGLGAHKVVPALLQEGCGTFFVAHPAEGEMLRTVAPEAVIYVLNGLWPGQAERLARSGLRPVLGSMAEVEEWAGFCRASGLEGEAALHIDTGMNRLGLDMAEAAQLAECGLGGPGFALTLVMSHFACADAHNHPLNERQRQRFAAIRPLFAGIQASLANSAGIMMGEAARYDMTRAGIALYGGGFVNGRAALEPVVQLHAPLVQVRRCKAGESVGYGAAWTAKRPTRIGIVSIGYADGFLRAASSAEGRPDALGHIDGVPCPIVGRISMDLMALDVTDAPQAERGDLVEILGENRSVEEAARAAGTIGYEILTSLGRRYQRFYVEE